MIDFVKPPFPWFGGKTQAAAAVWDKLGDVRHYIEPFAGGLGVLLCRPHPPFAETINDLDCYVANFWRATVADPETVAYWADWPVNETDKHARHLWLLGRSEFRERMATDPDYYDAKIAGWWVWGISMHIGSGWCEQYKFYNIKETPTRVIRVIPSITPIKSERGIRRKTIKSLKNYFIELHTRLRRVQVICGDWKRVVKPSILYPSPCGILLDPPYNMSDRDRKIYSVDTADIASDVRNWAIANGNNPQLRIAICGYDTEHIELQAAGWSVHRWAANGGYGNQANNRGRTNKTRETIWFSPHCLQSDTSQSKLISD